MFPVNAMLSQKTCPAVVQTAHSRSRPCRAHRMMVKASSSNGKAASPLSLRALGVLAAVQIAISGPALAGLPDGDAIRNQLPKGGNPAEKVKDQVGKVADPGDVAAKAGNAASKAKSSVKQEANGAGGNPLGDLSGGLPGSNVSKDDLPDGPKPGQALKDLPGGSAGSQVSSQVGKAASKGSSVADKAGSAAKDIKGKNPFGDLSGGLPGSNVSRDDLPNGPKPGQALKDLPGGSAGSQVSSQVGKAASKGGSVADKAGSVADKAGSAAKDIKAKNPFGDLSGGLPGSSVTKDDLPNGPKPGAALKDLPGSPDLSAVKNLPGSPDLSGQVSKAASKGGSVADKAGSAVKDIKGKNPLGDLSGGLPGSSVTKDDLPNGPKPGAALKDLPGSPDLSAVKNLPGSPDLSGQVSKAASKGGSVADKAGSAVKDIKGKNPLGDLSGGLPGSSVTKDDLPNGPKPGAALKDLPGSPDLSAVKNLPGSPDLSGQVGKAAGKAADAAGQAKSLGKEATRKGLE